MKKSEVEKVLVSGVEVAVVRGESWSPSFGYVTAMNAGRTIYERGSYRGKTKYDGVEVTFASGHKDVFPLNQIKDAKEVRDMEQARRTRAQSLDQAMANQKVTAEQAVAVINARLAAQGHSGRARVAATHSYGDYRITGWHVDIDPTVASTISTWS